MLGLPDAVHACLFDLDGVLTDTASVHTKAWKAMFDAFLQQRAEQTGEQFVPFDPVDDYLNYVDGKKREDGVRSFLASRDIELPDGDPDDSPAKTPCTASATARTTLLPADAAQRRRQGVRGLAALPGRGGRRGPRDGGGVLQRQHPRGARDHRAGASSSSSASTASTLRDEHIAGKPAPDSFLRAAQLLGVEPAAAAVFEDALAGVAAGRAGQFGFVVGVDRVGHADALRRNGADVVVTDLADLLDGTHDQRMTPSPSSHGRSARPG